MDDDDRPHKSMLMETSLILSGGIQVLVGDASVDQNRRRGDLALRSKLDALRAN
jgi:hypothetical protein